MNMNEMWELLEIEPTKDKKLIKQAYARAVKKYHPEENPEEFQKVYRAYKQALAASGKPGSIQAGDGLDWVYQMILQGQPQQGKPENPPESRETPLRDVEESGQGEPEDPPESREAPLRNGEEEQIQGLFREMREQRERKIFVFRQKWQWYLGNWNKESAEKEMREYIKTPWFQDIMEEPTVLNQLAFGLGRIQNGGGALKEDVWELYSLGNPKTQEDKNRHRTLFHALEADQERLCMKRRQEADMHRRMIETQIAENNVKLRKAWRVLGMGLVALIALTSILVGIEVYCQGGFSGKNISPEEEQEEIFSYLQESYPMAEFTWPQPIVEETEAFYGDGDFSVRNYRVKEKNFDIAVGAYAMQEDGELFIGEDFGRQYMRQLGERWGLSCGLYCVGEPWTDGETHVLMLGEYQVGSGLSGLEEDLEGYMERFREFAKSREVQEFANIEGVSFCVSDCFCPKAFIMEAGGVPEPLLYDLEELPEAEIMAADMAESIRDYYVHMEPWKVEREPLYRQWLAAYEDKVRKMGIEPSTPGGSAVSTIAEELGVQVLIYPCDGSEGISLGDLYRMAKRSDYPPSVCADGSGFRWKGEFIYEDTGDDRGDMCTCEIVVNMFAEE